MSKNTTKKIEKAIELYNLVFEEEKYINIINKDIIVENYKSTNFNNEKIIDNIIVLISEKLGKNMHILIKLYKYIRMSSVCVGVLGEVKEPTFTEQLESYYLPLFKKIAGALRFSSTLASIVGLYRFLHMFFSSTLGSLSYLILFCQVFIAVSKSSFGQYISNIDLKKILEHIKLSANRYFEEQGKLHAAIHEHIKV